MTFLAMLAYISEFIPIVNVVSDLAGTGDPTWWKFALKLVQSIMFLEILMPFFEEITRRTANTWDDGAIAKMKMVLAFALEIIAAVGAIDPQLGRRIKAVTGPRKVRP